MTLSRHTIRWSWGTAHHFDRGFGWRRSALFAIFLVVFPISGFTAGDLQYSGYYKNSFTVFNSPNLKRSEPMPPEPIIGAVSNRLRFNLSHMPNDLISFSTAYNFSPRIQDPLLFEEQPVFVAINPSGYWLTDVDSRVYPGENDAVDSFGIFQNLDRAVITLGTPNADISIGRQAIVWGSARVLNPTDIVALFT